MKQWVQTEGVILMETIIIVVYKDTINHKYNGDNNLSCIKVTREEEG